ncbi:MAG: UDPGP type 1 family protein [Firmicutes bacterium]|nr:UDPGP type 1 family protein [Bacillota bacterium]
MIPRILYKKLQGYGQEHLLRYYSELSEDQQKDLLEQVKNIDFDLVANLENLKKGTAKGEISPIGALDLKEIEEKKAEFLNVGLEALAKRKVAAVLLAGGQGSRLGFDLPKGMLNIGEKIELSLFEQLIKNLQAVEAQAGATVPLLIMTSEKNDQVTREYFEEKEYFGYDKNFVRFFVQEMAPATDYNGKIYLEEKDRVSLSPNGNGGWFSSLINAGLLKYLHELGVEWLNIFSVDNPLQKMADPVFVGATIAGDFVSGSKVVAKADPHERVGVLCLEDGKPSIVEYFELPEEMIEQRDENGVLLYNYGVILNYLFRLDRLESIIGAELPLYVVEKKIPYLNEEGNYIKPEENNGYKFETLVLDMIRLMDNCCAFEVEREKEFAPIKNATGVDSLETARALMKLNKIEL